MSLRQLAAKIQQCSEEAWYHGNMAPLDELYAADYVGHRPPFPDFIGPTATKESIAGTRLAYTDIQAIYSDWVLTEEMVVYRYNMRMKHTGMSPSLPIPPTGKVVTLQGCVMVRLKNGQVVEEWEYSDYLGFLQQLGLVPALA